MLHATQWLIADDVLERMKAASRIPGREPTAEERREFLNALKEHHGHSAARPRNMAVAGEVAQVQIKGALTEDPDCFAMLFGGGNTTYRSIRDALREAEADPAIKSIVLDVDSPGGTVHGLFETLDAIQAVTKPIRSVASLAASAAFAIVAVAGPIEARTEASIFGSIGVAASIWLEDDVLDLASTEAPNKRPDVKTPEGRAVVQAELDALHEIFVKRIAAGRQFTTGEDFDAKRINADFGRGGVLLSKEAHKRGMIDKYPKSIARAARSNHASAELGGSAAPPQDTPPMTMTKDQLKTQHPELFAAIFEEGRVAGEQKERGRVKAHLKLAKTAEGNKLPGTVEAALGFIESGASVQDDEVFAAYQTANMNRSAQNTRQSESDDAGKIVAGAKAPAEGEKDIGDLFAETLPAKKSA